MSKSKNKNHNDPKFTPFQLQLLMLEWAKHDASCRWCAVCGADWYTEHFSDCAMRDAFISARRQWSVPKPSVIANWGRESEKLLIDM